MNSILVEAPAPLKLPPSEGVGSMAAYLAMRERQKNEDAQKKSTIAGPSQTANEPVNAVDGENGMPDVGEAVGEDWVMKSINSAWKGYKSRIKTTHYTAYPTDEERLEKRPENIPLEDFKLLLQYWGDEEIQRKAKQNSETRCNYVDTHTAGPKLFSQIRHKMANESDGALFVKTRKRKENRKYKTDGKVNKFIIDKIEKAMGPDLSGPTDGVDDLLLKEKKYVPSWLIGRCGKSNKSSSSGPTNAQISDLTMKIRQDIIGEMEDNPKKVQEEVDAKVNKVHENLTWVLKKLGEANPGINIDLAQLYATISSDNDNSTPITGGATS